MTIDRQAKINALFTLLDFSMIISREMKDEIKKKIEDFSIEDIMNLGSILAYEHYNREKLDDMALKTFIESLNKSTK